MKNIAYKYQNYNKQFFLADAIITQYVSSIKAIKKKRHTQDDIHFCRIFESTVKNLFEKYDKKKVIWLYILYNEFPHKKKSYVQKEEELTNLNFPVSRASYYREVVLFTNLVAECFNFSSEYVTSKKELKNTSVPLISNVKSLLFEQNAA